MTSKGPAISLYSSLLILQEPLTTTFLNNSTLLYGRAIYADNVSTKVTADVCTNKY